MLYFGPRTLLFVAIVATCYVDAFAQAWVPEKGEATETLTAQEMFVEYHLGSSGEKVDTGHIRSFILFQDLDYGITGRLAVDISIPFVLSKYMGPRPHQLPVDNGNYHGNFQDVRINLRYNLRRRTLAITPFFSFGVPSNDYIFFAHSAAGTSQREYFFGSSFGRSFEPILSRAYMQALVGFLVPEKVQGVRALRSKVDWDTGYFVTHRLALRTVGGFQLGYSGFQVGHSLTDRGDFPIRTKSNVHFYHHDQTSRISYLNLGGGGSFALTPSLSAFAVLTTTVWGRNGHAVQLGETIGLSWSFRTPWARPQNALRDAGDEQQALYQQNSQTKSVHHSH